MTIARADTGRCRRHRSPEVAELVAEHNASLTELARAARDQAEASGTLVWDPFDPAWARDPYPVYRALRQSNPVHRSPFGFWVLTRHADCLAMLRDKRASSDGRNIDATDFPAIRDREFIEGTGAGEILAEMAPFIFRDPPDHTRLRGLVQKAFTPRVVEGCVPGSSRSATTCSTPPSSGGLRPRGRLRLPLPGADHRRDARRPGRGPRAVPGVVRCPRPRARPRFPAYRPTPSSSGWPASCRSSSTSPVSSKNAGPTRATICSPDSSRPRRRGTSSRRGSSSRHASCCSWPATRRA